MIVPLGGGRAESLKGVYQLLVKKKFFGESSKPRRFIECALDRIEELLKQGRVPVVRAPPGYGKTAISIAASVYSVLSEKREFLQVIHVVPTRSLIEDIYKRVSDGIRELGVEPDDFVSRQYGLVHEAPYLAGLFVVSTFDTYFYNLIKVSPAEADKICLGRSLGHYEVPRSSIFSSLNFLDEIHMFLEELPRIASVALSFIRALHSLRVPLVLSTATLPDKLINVMKDNFAIELELIDYQCRDDDFCGKEMSKTFETLDTRIQSKNGIVRLSSSKEVPKFIAEAVGRVLDGDSRASGSAVAVVVNTVCSAKEIFRELRERGIRPVLLHSRLTRKDRIERLEHVREKIKNSDKVVVVTTQVIEVGVDLSFDVMISELATPSSLVQRFGRLARGDKKSGFWLIYYTENAIDSEIYDSELVTKAKDYLTSKRVHWHLPEVDCNGITGYLEFINECWNKVDVDGLGTDSTIESIVTKPYIDSENVMNFLKNFGNQLRDENLCTVYLFEKESDIPDDIEKLISRFHDSALTLSCDDGFKVSCAALKKGYRPKVILINGKDVSSREASKEDLRDLKNINHVLCGTKIVALPRDLYEGGIYGEGLKEPRSRCM